MFSYFQKGITDIIPSKTIDLSSLVKIIKNNPKVADINLLIREKKAHTVIDGKEHYKTLKAKLPYITPNCIVKRRDLKNWTENFIDFSQYIYFDIDLNTCPFVAKAKFLEKHKDEASLVSLSASNGGISILFKVSNKMKTEQDFNNVRQKLFEKYFQNEEDLDHSVKDLGRAWFIPSDQDVYVNYEAEIDVILDSNDNVNQNINYVNQGKSFGEYNNTLIYTANPLKTLHNDYNKNTYKGSIISLKTLYEDYKFESDVDVKNNIVDYNPVDNYLQIKYPKNIPDGHKHKVYAGIISTFIKLNPNIEFDAVYSLLYHINKSNTQQMQLTELYSSTLFIYNINMDSKQIYSPSKVRTKNVHFNKQSNLDKKIKSKIANDINGIHRRNGSIKKIKDAIENLLKNGIKVTKSAVMRETGLANKTVIKHWDSVQINIGNYITTINLEYNLPNSIHNKEKTIDCYDEAIFNMVKPICDYDLSNHPILAC